MPCSLLLSVLLATPLQAAPPLLVRSPALNRTHIVFHFAGDLWTVPRDGGQALRLTSGPGTEADPHFSPDGQSIAFTGEYDGNVDVFVVPAAGGVPQRLTWHPTADSATGWTPDGKRILFRSGRNSYSRFNRLFTVPATGGFPEEVPLTMAEDGAYSPDGAELAYLPLAPAFQTWKRYRGGRTTPIWLARLTDSSVRSIPRNNSNDFNPMWLDSRIFFLSDRDGPVTLFSFDTKSNRVTRVLAPQDFDIKSASLGPGAIAFERLGAIWLLDLKTLQPRKVEVTINSDFPEVRPRRERVSANIAALAISPTGARAVLEARGEIFTVPAEKGDPRNLTNTTSAADRSPAWSPDGRSIAWFSDESGEYELHIREQNGAAPARKLRLSDPPSFYYNPVWSPDSKKIAFTAKDLSLAWIDVASAKVTIVDTDRYLGPRQRLRAAWSPDSKWLTYTKQLPNMLRAVFVYSLDSGQVRQITDGMSDANLPVFDRDGKYLYFTASTDYGLNLGWRDMSSFNRPTVSSVYAAVLRKDLPSPVLPESDEEKQDDPKPATPPANAKSPTQPPDVKIDFDNLEQRIVALPIPARNYFQLAIAKTGVLLLAENVFRAAAADAPPGAVIHKFDLKTRKTDKLLEGAQGWDVSANGEKMLVRQAGRLFITSTSAPPKPGEGTLKLDAMEVHVDPPAEWRQMFAEAWRIQRDFFYSPNLHGVDIPSMRRKYEPFLDAIATRADLNYLFNDMMGEFSISHLYVIGGQTPPVRRVPGGLLGADYSIENNRYRFARVLSGESWNPGLRAPLTQPGVNVVAGEYLLAVNGRDLTAAGNVYAALEGTAGKQVLLKVGPDSSGANSRTVTVVPIDTEYQLRNLAWIEENRRTVDRLSKGKLAYLYIPDTSFGGYTNFNRYFFAQVGKQGVVVDERFNSGGAQPDYMIDYLRRPLLHYRTARHGEEFTGPMGAIFGPRAMLINEYAGSGGDSFPWYFRQTKLGPLVGKRTWGGLVGGMTGWPLLLDGGSVSSPGLAFWDPLRGEWVAENTGIAPDIEVEADPKTMRQGRDPQLEKAVQILLDELNKTPAPTKPRPPFPNYQPKKQ